MFLDLLNIYYFPTMGLNDYPGKQNFMTSVNNAMSTGTNFDSLISEYNILKTYILNKLSENPSERSKFQTFNRMRVHIQLELQKFSGSPVFENCNI